MTVPLISNFADNATTWEAQKPTLRKVEKCAHKHNYLLACLLLFPLRN